MEKEKKPAIVVTGGGGYIGSILVEGLVLQGYPVLVVDNLQQGHRQAVDLGALLLQGPLGDSEFLEGVFRQHNVGAVMHLAAESQVGLSVKEPERFFEVNVSQGLSLLRAMLRAGVKRLIFSSTAAVYGEPASVPIPEEAPLLPVNAYGESKVMFERVLSWYGQAYGLRSISLRYFNAAGASQRFGEDHRPETHLIPIILKVALGQQDHLPIFGDDYDTPDGTCIRDYVHVIDIARAHILALERLDSLSGRCYNLGNGEGFSVQQVWEKAREVTAVDIPARVYPRRKGDPARLVASSARARAELGWQPQYRELGSIIESAWRWQKEHPMGYPE